jgi:hypothetical protein
MKVFFPTEAATFPFATISTSSPIQYVLRANSPAINLPELEADWSPPSSAEVND